MKALTPILHSLLAFCLAFPPQVFAAGETGMAAGILNGTASALGNINELFSSYGNSANQLNALATQLSLVQAQASGVQNPQGQLDRLQQQMDLVKMQTMDCLQKASPSNYDKYFSKRKGKDKEVVKNMGGEQLTSMTPYCSTTALMADAIAVNKAKMEDAQKKMVCMTNLNTAMTEIANAAKAPLTALTEAATKVQKTHTQIIDIHSGIAQKIANDVYGQASEDGTRKGGYRDQLAQLIKRQSELENVINGEAGKNDEGLEFGLGLEVREYNEKRAGVANYWYFTMLEDIHNCFYGAGGFTYSCFNNNQSAAPAACLSMMVSNQAMGSVSAGTAARAAKDQQGLQNIANDNRMAALNANLPANIDANRPDQFLRFFKNRFDATLAPILNNYARYQYKSNVKGSDVSQFVNQAYHACYDKVTREFNSSMNLSKSGKYYAAKKDVELQQGRVANKLKAWITRVTGEMSDFRNSFYKVYNSELNQFGDNCTANADPTHSLDCLKALNATLKGGIDGTAVTAQLSTGAKIFPPQAADMQVETLSLDANGKPTRGTAKVTCTGFKDCIDYLEGTMRQHQSAQQKSEEDRSNFVENHNTAASSTLDILSKKMAELSQVLTGGIAGVKAGLSEAGVATTLEPKAVEVEELAFDDNTKLMKVPKEMKKALAGRNSLMELDKDEIKKVTDDYNSRVGELNKKAVEVANQARKCKIEKADYEGLASIMPKNCTPVSQICSRDRVARGAADLESLFKRSQDDPENSDFEKVSSNSDYRSCKMDAKQEAEKDLNDDAAIAEYARGRDGVDVYVGPVDGVSATSQIDEKLRTKYRALMKKEAETAMNTIVRGECADVVTSGLKNLAAKGRGNLSTQNGKIVQALADVNAACSVDPFDEEAQAAAVEACQAYVKTVKAAKAPDNEEPTEASGGSGSKNSSNPLTLPSAQ